MGIEELIATDLDDYVNIIKKLMSDKKYYNEICNKIIKNNYKLFEEKESVNDWNNMLHKLIMDIRK